MKVVFVNGKLFARRQIARNSINMGILTEGSGLGIPDEVSKSSNIDRAFRNEMIRKSNDGGEWQNAFSDRTDSRNEEQNECTDQSNNWSHFLDDLLYFENGSNDIWNWWLHFPAKFAYNPLAQNKLRLVYVFARKRGTDKWKFVLSKRF